MKLRFWPTCAVEFRITVNYEIVVVPGVRENFEALRDCTPLPQDRYTYTLARLSGGELYLLDTCMILCEVFRK